MAHIHPEGGDFPVVKPTAPKESCKVFRPSHYTHRWPEPITIVNAWGLNFNLGSAVKYIARAGHKDDWEQDLRKAIRYLELEIEFVKRRHAVEKGEADREFLVQTL
jgi:hypothetical protein